MTNLDEAELRGQVRSQAELGNEGKTHRNKIMMPPGRTISQAFKERGIDDVVKIETFPLKTDSVVVTFEAAKSILRQGIWLKTDSGISIDGESYSSVTLWQDTASVSVVCHCDSTDSRLFLYNIWERDGTPSSLCYSSGMLIDEIPTGRRYRCNDIGFDTKFDKLVFRVEHNE